MLYGVNSDDGHTGWAQIGFIYDATAISVERYFWQYYRDGSDSGEAHATAYWGSLSGIYGTSQDFKVERQSDGKIHMQLNGTETCNMSQQCPVTPFDPDNVWSYTNAEFSGETRYYEDDMPGYGSSHDDLSLVEEKDSSGSWSSHSWAKLPATLPCYYNRSVITTNTEFNIWTYPKNHVC
jgi:hypothetical protein